MIHTQTTAPSTDTGHYNCRDYLLPPPRPPPPTTSTTSALPKPPTTSQILARRAAHQSPLNKPINRQTFPFLRLPCELRRHIYSYLLPYTETKASSGSLVIPPSTSNANAAVAAHQIHLASLPAAKYVKDTIIWHRGQTSLLCVNTQLFQECAAILYGQNVFVLSVAYDMISFRFRCILPSRLAPSHAYDFLALLRGPRYMPLIKRLLVSVEHVDEYTGMIKFNVGGSGLTHGLRLQLMKLVRALKPTCDSLDDDQGLKMLTLTLTNGNQAVLDSEKRGILRSRDSSVPSTEDVQTLLEPLYELSGLTDVMLYGAITNDYKECLRQSMMAKT
jgi:hypothetical protein